MNPLFQPHDCLSEKQIQHYLDDNLGKSGRQTVENHLLDCPLCAEAVEGYRLLQEENTIHRDATPPRRMRLYTRLAWAAAILTTAVSLWLLVDQPQSRDLYAAYFEKYPNDITSNPRGSSEPTEPGSLLEQGVILYTEGNFQESRKVLAEYLRQESSDPAGTFYLGLTLLESGQISEATHILRGLAPKTGPYSEEASWYLALAYLREGKKDQAKDQLKTLIDAGKGRYFKQAKSLFSKL